MGPWEVEDSLGIVGRLLGGQYVVDRPLGQGAFAIVYHAVNELGEEAAIKLSRTNDRSALFRFDREVKVMESLPRSPHLVAYKSHGKTTTGQLYLAMEYVPGPTLADGLRTRSVLEPDEACACVGQIALALQTLHRFSIVHRDLKPSNVLLSLDGLVKLFDFGLILDPDGMLSMFETSDIVGGKNFAEEVERGMLVGTPEYMAIEQFEDARAPAGTTRKTCPASDVFSAGVILYRMITGAVPFPMRCEGQKPTSKEIIDYLKWRSEISSVDLVPPVAADGALWKILSRALSTEPWVRQPTGKALADELFWYLTSGRSSTIRVSFDGFEEAGEDAEDDEADEPTLPRLKAQELFGDVDLSSYSLESDIVTEDTVREHQSEQRHEPRPKPHSEPPTPRRE
jgi:eukaryotic-like serine/threonine-protein kinase